LQLGSLMASLYLLGNLDHYTNLKFKVFWWKSYVSEVKQSWPMDEDNSDRGNSGSGEPSVSNAGIDTNRVVLTKGTNGYVGSSNVDDYTFRLHALENVPLYDYFQMSERKKCMAKE
ncbi:hypothetical protein B0H10DRAFT_1744725, partial [Mycena sp. CBHHK59/15]